MADLVANTRSGRLRRNPKVAALAGLRAFFVVLIAAGLTLGVIYLRNRQLLRQNIAALVNSPLLSRQHVAATSQSAPVNLKIPSLNIDASIVPLGLTPQHELQIPAEAAQVGWFEYGAVPGEAGPAVLVGHLDWWTTSRGIFYNLHNIKPGAEIIVTKQDGSTVTFVAGSIQSVPQNNFPTTAVYGKTDAPVLRLITCSGQFNRQTAHYTQNLIVYASLKP